MILKMDHLLTINNWFEVLLFGLNVTLAFYSVNDNYLFINSNFKDNQF